MSWSLTPEQSELRATARAMATEVIGPRAAEVDQLEEHPWDNVKQREQFGRPVAEFQGLQWMLADMSVQLEAARSLTYRAAASRGPGDSPFPDPAPAAQAKIVTAEAAIQVVSDALQTFGAAGYSRRNPLERTYRDVRMFTIGGGTAQILRTVVASRILDMKLPQSRDGFSRLAVQDDGA